MNTEKRDIRKGRWLVPNAVGSTRSWGTGQYSLRIYSKPETLTSVSFKWYPEQFIQQSRPITLAVHQETMETQAFSSLCRQRRNRHKENQATQHPNIQGMISQLLQHCWSGRTQNNTWQVFQPCRCEWWLWSCTHWWIYVYITMLLLLFLSTSLGGILNITSDNASLKACQIETVHAPASSCPLLQQFWAAVSVPTLSHVAESIKLHVKNASLMSKEKIRWQTLNKPALSLSMPSVLSQDTINYAKQVPGRHL